MFFEGYERLLFYAGYALRNSDETDTVKGTNANDKKSPLLSLIIDEVNHEAYHDFKRNKRFLEIMLPPRLDDDLMDLMMDLLRYDELDLVFGMSQTFEP